ncbi:MAG: hypothetical protein EPN85_03970 [Bacteroidetes bacterium]|nr:MAG: hypothetical protein EPN85_03970 [Bacteroidota bacterium]
MEYKKICPYPGLRPFNDDESIYFKGRDKNIDSIVDLVEKKKFVMLTGASGDGKSSLVYAGVLPRARAGLLKAKYSSWKVADFRPERDPLGNLTRALHSFLNTDNFETFRKKLSYGFNALVNTYKKSPLFIDVEGKEWKEADEPTKKQLRKKAGNLIIIADQFEEFFTNIENYHNGSSSVESQTVVNLLLETARIALAEYLPVYVILTMRSDYIGQCASFRGLPEYIGFSEFFVPRLKRHDLVQVIEEPAKLNGDRISRRLTEHLLNDITDGYDQLPILQHALNQIWQAADNGKEEMDLIHYAKVGGLDKTRLPDADKIMFEKWLLGIPPFKVKLFEKPSLENVLNAHANELLEKAYDYFVAKHPENANVITREDFMLIVKTTYQCLTKIDESRAVRNRMTLQEISDIIQRPHITARLVGKLLDIFRLQGNTFLKPFITDKPESLKTHKHTILDITHESLIRNWSVLKNWADEEYENWQQFHDFNKQLQRWISNEKQKGYLLPIGPLSFFEDWYNSCKPNKYWLKKYDESETPETEKDAKAHKIIEDASLFLKSSRQAIRRKKNLLVYSTVTVVLILLSFTVWAFLERNKALEQQLIAEQKTQEAVNATKEAIRSKEEALKSQRKAIESEQLAVSAKDTALKAKEQAMVSQQEALKQKSRAEAETRNAQEQSLIAKRETEKAEQQRAISEKEKNKAEKAEMKARQLSLISVSQNLALKSALQNTNPQLQGLLAMQAYRFTKQNGGKVQDPAIYEALRSAYSSLASNSNAVLKGSSAEVRTLAENSTSLASAGKDGVVNYWNVSKGKSESSVGLKYSSPNNFIFISSNGALAASGHENKAVCVWSMNGGKISFVEMKGRKELLRTASFSPDFTTVAAAGKDSMLTIWNVQSGKVIKEINMKSFVKTILYTSNENSLAVITENGEVNLISVSEGSIQNIYSSQTSLPLCGTYIPQKNTLACGFSDGKIRLFNLSASGKVNQLGDNITRVEQISVKNNMLAVSCSDKTIKIYELGNTDLKPIHLKDHKTKVRSLIFDKENKIIAGCEDKTIRVWDTSSDKIAEKLCSLLTRNMTLIEWKQFVGEKIEYEKTCSK